MSGSKVLIKTLKKVLRSRGITYADIAKNLKLSEASIKRMFSLEHITLERLDSICTMLELDIIDLIRIIDLEQEKITNLTFEQEKELVSDTKFLLVAICVHNLWNFNEIVDKYKITETECIKYLARLDRLGLIQLLPNNKIRSMIAHDFQWLPDGPIEKFFEREVQNEFMKSKFKINDELRIYITGTLSKKSIDILKNNLKGIARQYSDLQIEDSRLPIESRFNTGLLMAIRPWELRVFSILKRDGK